MLLLIRKEHKYQQPSLLPPAQPTWQRRSGSMSASLVMTLISLPLQPSLGRGMNIGSVLSFLFEYYSSYYAMFASLMD